jgi:hypothetical protein
VAGDWIKLEKPTLDKPEVFAIATKINIDADAVLGKLFRVWNWFDDHTQNGNAHGVTHLLLDRLTAVTGFGDAMIEVGWMIETDGNLTIPHFERHNGETAKKRAVTKNRVEKYRNLKRSSNADGNAEGVTADVTATLPNALPEKRRSKPPYIPPQKHQLNGAFIQFWTAYPRKVAKGAAEKAWVKIHPDDTLAASIVTAVERAKASADWRKDGGQFIPHPATWLNGRRWEDEPPKPVQPRFPI